MGGFKRQSFDAATLALCQEAFNDTLEALQTAEWSHVPQCNEAARAAIARSIIERAAAGETDPAQLRKLTLETLFSRSGDRDKAGANPSRNKTPAATSGRRVTT